MGFNEVSGPIYQSINSTVYNVYIMHCVSDQVSLSFEFATTAETEVKLHLSYSQNHAKKFTSKVGVGNQQPFPSHGSWEKCSLHLLPHALLETSVVMRRTTLSLKRIVVVEIGRAHVWTPVTWNDLVCRLLLEKKKLLFLQQILVV